MIIDILTALIVVVVVGVVSGIILTLASHYLHIPENKMVKKLRECLPGVNCGACGFTGCDEYAKALAAGSAKPDLCVPGSSDTAAKLSEILGVEVSLPEDLVAVLKCNGNCDAAVDKADYDGLKTCAAANLIYGGPKGCSYGCIGYGDCTKLCPVGAISIKNGIASIDTRICIGCGVCAKNCPKKVIELVPQDKKVLPLCSNKQKGALARKVCKNACIGCKKCELNCPNGAIKVIDNLAAIDYAKCTDCGICAEVCTTKCINKVDLYTSVRG